ncbi:hypothetical protein CH063_14121 [Colletotrichum higginsianum]|uniref:Uncharacterized protein n=1 Tax=Colletotrichum higginsianum (strain IMI 349063) TaxID=759273 RepID=H1VX90_COLHI|nr:hypothetical protein CH063_14121 [Colletotrichum higginsianum]
MFVVFREPTEGARGVTRSERATKAATKKATVVKKPNVFWARVIVLYIVGDLYATCGGLFFGLKMFGCLSAAWLHQGYWSEREVKLEDGCGRPRFWGSALFSLAWDGHVASALLAAAWIELPPHYVLQGT